MKSLHRAFPHPLRACCAGTALPRQRGASRLSLVLAVVLAAAAGAGGSWWWQQRAAASAASESSPASNAAAAPPTRRFGSGSRNQPVTVAAVQRMDMRVMLSAIGNMAALNTAVVRARVDGELRAIRFKEGQTVKAGDLLAEIDPRPFQVALAQAQGQLTRDQAQLRNARLDLARYQDLLAKDSIAKQQVDTQEALVKQLQGTVQTDEAQVDNARLQLSYTKVQAPIGGRLGLKQADLGSTVRASDANGLVTITQTQPIALVFSIPETQLRAIQRKLQDKAPVPVQAWDRDQKTLLGEGRVITTDNAIDPTTGTLKLKAEFANADGSLFPNQFVNVRLQIDQLSQALAVPGTAIQRGAKGTFVYAVKDDGTVGMRPVRVGATEGDWVSVQGELAVGEKVVTDGADRLRDGAKVEVITPPPAKGGKAGKVDGAESRAEKPKENTQESSKEKSAPGPEGRAGAAIKKEANPSQPKPAPAPAAEPSQEAKPQQPQPAAAASSGDLPPWLDRLPPEMQERFKAMNAQERQAFIEKMRERRRQREAQGG